MSDSHNLRWWQSLNRWLGDFQAFWRVSPFSEPEPAWAQQWPGVAGRLEELDDARCQAFEADPSRLVPWLEASLPDLAEREPLLALPHFTGPASTLPETRAAGMPGRKRRQAGALVAALRPLDSPVTDWCCGKGHLARTIVPWSPSPVTGLEFNPKLVAAGNRIAAQAGDPLILHCQDVLAEDLQLGRDQHLVALHACGELHRRLLCSGAAAGLPRLSLSPCCYHLIDSDDHQPLSARLQARPERLALGRSELRLAVRETVTAPARVQRHTALASRWRLGFDGLQRYLRGLDEYLAVPPLPPRLLTGSFRDFCAWAATQKTLTLPAGVDYDHWEAHGVRRLARVRRHELLRHLFRRPLELWLALDYVLFLEEQGYGVRFGSFCDRALTPRNLLIDAVRAPGIPPTPRSHCGNR